VAKQAVSTPQDKSGSKPAARTRAGGKGSGGGGRLATPSIGNFYRESVAELRKVTWPSWQDASNLTVAVLAMTIVVAAFLGAIDAILEFLIKPILGT